MSSSSYLPYNDSAFSTWLDTFFAYLEPNFAKFGLVAADVTAAKGTQDAFDVSLAAHIAAQSAARTATTTKDDNRATCESSIRALVGRIQAAPGTTDADREALGITIRGAGTSDMPLPTNDDKPIALVDVSSRLKHVIRIQNQTSVGVKKAKPAGAMGAEVWVKVGETPSGPSDMQLIGLATRSPYVVEYPDDNGGKQAHYAMRWVTSKGEKGSWSETESATIAA